MSGIDFLYATHVRTDCLLYKSYQLSQTVGDSFVARHLMDLCAVFITTLRWHIGSEECRWNGEACEIEISDWLCALPYVSHRVGPKMAD